MLLSKREGSIIIKVIILALMAPHRVLNLTGTIGETDTGSSWLTTLQKASSMIALALVSAVVYLTVTGVTIG